MSTRSRTWDDEESSVSLITSSLPRTVCLCTHDLILRSRMEDANGETETTPTSSARLALLRAQTAPGGMLDPAAFFEDEEDSKFRYRLFFPIGAVAGYAAPFSSDEFVRGTNLRLSGQLTSSAVEYLMVVKRVFGICVVFAGLQTSVQLAFDSEVSEAHYRHMFLGGRERMRLGQLVPGVQEIAEGRALSIADQLVLLDGDEIPVGWPPVLPTLSLYVERDEEDLSREVEGEKVRVVFMRNPWFTSRPSGKAWIYFAKNFLERVGEFLVTNEVLLDQSSSSSRRSEKMRRILPTVVGSPEYPFYEFSKLKTDFDAAILVPTDLKILTLSELYAATIPTFLPSTRWMWRYNLERPFGTACYGVFGLEGPWWESKWVNLLEHPDPPDETKKAFAALDKRHSEQAMRFYTEQYAVWSRMPWLLRWESLVDLLEQLAAGGRLKLARAGMRSFQRLMEESVLLQLSVMLGGMVGQ